VPPCMAAAARGPSTRRSPPPPTPFDDNRGADRGPKTELADHGGDRAGRALIAVHARGLSGPQHQRADVVAVDGSHRPDRHLVARGAPAGDQACRPAGVVAPNVRRVAAYEHADLPRHGFEELGGGDAAGDQRRDAAQRRLLVRDADERLAAGGVGDRGGDELGELGQPIFDALGQGRAIERVSRHRTPDLAIDDDRSACARADPGRAGGASDRPRNAGEVLDPLWAPALEDHGADRRPVERPARPNPERVRMLAPLADHHCRPVGLVAPQRNHREADHRADLHGDRGQHVRRSRPPGDE
jgi:hypothetical protein